MFIYENPVFIKNYLIVDQIEGKIPSIDEYLKTLKPKEIIDKAPEDIKLKYSYGLEEEAKAKNYEVKKVKLIITYYYADNTPLQGGYNDKYGKPLHSHKVPICAAPSDINYGSILVLDSPVLDSTEFKIVDTGSAIRWIDSNTCRIDIFVPWAHSIEDITHNLENVVVEGKIYIKK